MPFALVAAIAAGTFIAVQSALIGGFGQRVPAITVALWIHIAGTIAALAGVLVSGSGFHLAAVREFPWGLSAGIFGVGIVTAIAVALGSISLASTLAVLTGTQLLLAFVMEANGLLGEPIRPDPVRYLGALLLVVGVLLIFGRGRSAV